MLLKNFIVGKIHHSSYLLAGKNYCAVSCSWRMAVFIKAWQAFGNHADQFSILAMRITAQVPPYNFDLKFIGRQISRDRPPNLIIVLISLF